MESFWGTLQSELVHHRRYKTRQEAIQEITEYIEIFYNRQRRQAKLGFLSPAAFEQQFFENFLLNFWILISCNSDITSCQFFQPSETSGRLCKIV